MIQVDYSNNKLFLKWVETTSMVLLMFTPTPTPGSLEKFGLPGSFSSKSSLFEEIQLGFWWFSMLVSENSVNCSGPDVHTKQLREDETHFDLRISFKWSESTTTYDTRVLQRNLPSTQPKISHKKPAFRRYVPDVFWRMGFEEHPKTVPIPVMIYPVISHPNHTTPFRAMGISNCRVFHGTVDDFATTGEVCLSSTAVKW